MKASTKLISFSFAAVLLAATAAGGAHAVEIEQVFKNLSEIEEPFELRDPFQPLKFRRRGEKEAETPIKNGVYTNVPEIGKATLDQINITGVVVGPERRAFAQIKGEEQTYILREGMLLGANEAEVKAILPGGIILVEKITNIYGEVEYLETVIPISK